MKLDRRIGTISQIWRFGDTSDEIIGIIGIPAICEYTLRPVDIYRRGGCRRSSCRTMPIDRSTGWGRQLQVRSDMHGF